MAESPLAEADPKSINDLFNEDPLNLTDNDVDSLVAELRKNRELWAKEEASAQAEGRKRRPKTYKPKMPPGQLTLGDIGLAKK